MIENREKKEVRNTELYQEEEEGKEEGGKNSENNKSPTLSLSVCLKAIRMKKKKTTTRPANMI